MLLSSDNLGTKGIATRLTVTLCIPSAPASLGDFYDCLNNHSLTFTAAVILQTSLDLFAPPLSVTAEETCSELWLPAPVSART